MWMPLNYWVFWKYAYGPIQSFDNFTLVNNAYTFNIRTMLAHIRNVGNIDIIRQKVNFDHVWRSFLL